MYARLDVDSSALDASHSAVGVTNVDVNPPLRAALASLRAGEPIHLNVGDDGLLTTTLDGSVMEEKVPLPIRWLKGFAETQMLSSRMSPVHSLDATAARTFIHSLPRNSSTRRSCGQPARCVPCGLPPAPPPDPYAWRAPNVCACLSRSSATFSAWTRTVSP